MRQGRSRDVADVSGRSLSDGAYALRRALRQPKGRPPGVTRRPPGQTRTVGRCVCVNQRRGLRRRSGEWL